MKIDLAFFGVHPTIWLERFFVPWLTDFLALAYASYYFIPVVLIVILYFWGKEEEFSVTICTLLLGYYLSFVEYITMPTIGPRFTLESLQNIPLQGGGITGALIHILNAIEGTTMDCFPSGHTQMTLISLWFAFTISASSLCDLSPHQYRAHLFYSISQISLCDRCCCRFRLRRDNPAARPQALGVVRYRGD